MSDFKLLIKLLQPEHFDTEVAKEVFGDRLETRTNPFRRMIDRRVTSLMRQMSPTRLTVASVGLSRMVFPFMSAAGRREFARILFETCPNALPQLNHVWPHVKSLGAAVSASEHFNADILNRLCAALKEK